MAYIKNLAIITLCLLMGSFAVASDLASSERNTIQVGFSPEGTARELVLRVIESAQDEILLMGYSFTSPEIVKALIAAHRKGVVVKVVLDKEGNTREANLRAMRLINNAGIELRLNDSYQTMHDKVIIADKKHVETGSYNYSAAAAKYNSENVIVIWNNPELAKIYVGHWNTRWQQGKVVSN